MRDDLDEPTSSESAMALALEQPPRRRRRTLSVVVALATVVPIVAVAVLLGSAQPSAEDQLAAIRSFVSEADTAHFLAAISWEDAGGGDGSLGSSFSSRSRAEGDLVLPDQGHWILDSGDFATEVIATGDAAYLRFAQRRSELATERFAYHPSSGMGPLGGATMAGPMDGMDGGLVAGFAQGGPGLSWMGPGGLEQVLSALRSPERVSPSVIRATLPIGDLLPKDLPPGLPFGNFPRPEGTATIELGSDKAGRLERMVWRVEVEPMAFEGGEGIGGFPGMGPTRETTDVTFSRWGERVDLAVPPSAEVDTTPSIDEEDLAAFAAFKLLAPRSLPKDFELVAAQVQGAEAEMEMPELPAGMSFPDLSHCATSATLSWAKFSEALMPFDPKTGEMAPSLTLYLSPADCREGPFGLGQAIVSDLETGFGSGFHTAARTVEGVFLEASGNLPEEELTRVLADLVPFDLGTQAIHVVRPPGE